MIKDNISEMARVMCGRDKDCILCPVQSPCLMRTCAELLNAEDYRKASDVAREIFEDIERLITKECLVFKDENGIRGYVDASVHYAIAELKKKYIGDKR